MSARETANADFEFSVTQMGANKPGITKGGKTDVDVMEASQVKAGGEPVLVMQIGQKGAAVTWKCEGPTKNSTAESEVFVGGIFNMPATAVKTKADQKPCMRKGDFIMCTCVCTAPQKVKPPIPPVITPGSCKIEITDAGQSTVKAL